MPHVDVKICGLTNVEDARLALDAGADFLGFVLYVRSPRGITAQALARLAADLPADCRKVGVFVNDTPETVAAVVAACGLYAAQIHGDEDRAPFEGIGVRLWRALHVCPDGVRPDPGAWGAERYVVDAAVPGMYGGTGLAADWQAASGLAARVPVMLAGGLNSRNVAAAIDRVRPMGIDVASGVEAAPGRKDPGELRAFVAAARQAASHME